MVPEGGGLQGGVRELGARRHVMSAAAGPAPTGPRSGGRARQAAGNCPGETGPRGARDQAPFCLAEGQKTRVVERPGGGGQGGSHSFSELLWETIDRFGVRERLGWTQEDWKMAGDTFPRGIYILAGQGQAPDQVRLPASLHQAASRVELHDCGRQKCPAGVQSPQSCSLLNPELL